MFDLNLGERLFCVNWSIEGNRGAGSFWFAVSDAIPVGQEEEELREVIERYYDNVPAGQEESIRGYNPNWGDAIDDVEFLGTGFRLLDLPICASIDVDHDEAVYVFSEDEDDTETTNETA